MRIILLLFIALIAHGQAEGYRDSQLLAELRRNLRHTKLGKPFKASGAVSGFTGDSCSNSSECASGRWCMHSGICFPENEEDFHCSCSKKCRTGETCVDSLRDTGTSSPTKTGSCISSALHEENPTTMQFPCDKSVEPASPTPSSPSSSCIDSSLLGGFAAHELVFEQHRNAVVLCDRFGSCATGGHIVHYKGKAMMMRRYCGIVGCEEKIMKVNSPVRRRGLRVETKSKDLRFTAFAARYETRAEEIVLSTAVHIGL